MKISKEHEEELTKILELLRSPDKETIDLGMSLFTTSNFIKSLNGRMLFYRDSRFFGSYVIADWILKWNRTHTKFIVYKKWIYNFDSNYKYRAAELSTIIKGIIKYPYYLLKYDNDLSKINRT